MLISTLVLTAVFSYWLIVESEDERLHGVFIQHDRLLLLEKRKEAYQLLVDAIGEEPDGPLDPIWLPLVRATGNGYVQLGYLIRVLEAAPHRESTYREIANLIEIAPPSFHVQVKSRYLEDLNAISGVQPFYLKKYKLQSSEE